MTTSYATSLRMKELGFPQEGGEYYWVRNLFNENEVLHESALPSAEINFVLCRAFTLGELVRMLPQGFWLWNIPLRNVISYKAELQISNAKTNWNMKAINKENTSPEEAAAELCCELVVSGVIKFEKEG